MLKLKKRGKTYYAVGMVKGKRVNRSLHEKDARKAAEKASKLERSIRDGVTAVPTVEEWWERYQATYTAGKASVGGKLNDARAMKLPLEWWGKLPLDSIKPSHILQMQQKLLEKFASNTARMKLAVLSAFFHRAVKDGLIRESPMAGIKLPRRIPRKRVLTLDEQDKLMIELAPKYQVAVKILLGTGLREAEFCNLSPASIHADGLHVVGKGNKPRVVPLTPEVRALLTTWQPLTPSALLCAVKTASKRVGIPRVTVHDLRRTFATRCAIAGVPPMVLAKILGHESVQTTDQYYVHVSIGDAEAALNRVNLGISETGWGKVLPIARKV